MTKILIASWPALGHVNPLLEFACELKKVGYEIAFYSSNTYKEKVSKKNIDYFDFNHQREFTGETLKEVFPEYFQIENPQKKFKWGVSNIIAPTIEGFFLDIMEIKQKYDFDLLVVDPTMTGTVPFKMINKDVPVICMGLLPMQISSKDTAPYGLGIVPKKNLLNKAKYVFLNNYIQKIFFGEQQKVFNNYLSELGLPKLKYPFLDAVQQYSDLYLQGTIEEFEYFRSDLPANTKYVGPFIGKTEKMKSNSIVKKYNKLFTNGKRNVLITQGTLSNADYSELIYPSLDALEKENVNLIVTTGTSTSNFEQKYLNKDNIYVESYIPYDQILPFIDIIITNSGYGGVQQALMHNTMILACGTSEDKPEVGARVEYSGCGINLKKYPATVLDIKEAFFKLINDESFCRNSRKISEKMSQRNGFDESINWIKKVLED